MTKRHVGLPRIHPREPIVNQASRELDEAVSAIVEKHALTYAELFRILNELEADWIRSAIRAERHPDAPDRPGGWE